MFVSVVMGTKESHIWGGGLGNPQAELSECKKNSEPPEKPHKGGLGWSKVEFTKREKLFLGAKKSTCVKLNCRAPILKQVVDCSSAKILFSIPK